MAVNRTDLTRRGSVFMFVSFCMGANLVWHAVACGQANSVTIEPDDTRRDIIYKAAHVIPSPRQLAWQEMEFIAFIHFNTNTFTNIENGVGREGEDDPKVFNPTALDVRQWVRVCKEAGMKMIVLTVKHIEGFCLWPSKYTERSVKNSPWKNGKGDLVKEVSDACREGGLKFGFYLAPWDLHEPRYGSNAYDVFFKNQLQELLTNYGPIREVWFDGAWWQVPYSKIKRKPDYDWEGYYKLVRKYQPQAVIAIDGLLPDVRWVGNEDGVARETEWSVQPADLASVSPGTQLRWYPAECDVSIRPGWFYHPEEDDKVKSLDHLLDIYYKSVGRKSVLLLNLPPDRRGLIHENDVRRLRQFRAVLDATFKENLAAGAATRASHVRSAEAGARVAHGPEMTVDGDKETYWTVDEWTTAAVIEYDLGTNKTFNRAMLQEYIRVGQRVEQFALEAWDGKTWKEFARGTTIGYKRLLRFADVTARKVRLRIIRSRVCPTLSNFGLYYAPPISQILGASDKRR